MPWWIWCYLVLFGILTAGGCFDDLRDRRPGWYAAVGVVSGAIAIIGTISFWRGLPELGLPRLWLPVVVTALLWEAYAAWEDARSPELAGRLGALVIVMAILLLAPAYVLALIAAARPWI